MENLHLYFRIFFFTVFFVKSQKFELEFINVAIIDQFTFLIIYWELFCYQFGIFNIKISRWRTSLARRGVIIGSSFHRLMTLLRVLLWLLLLLLM